MAKLVDALDLGSSGYSHESSSLSDRILNSRDQVILDLRFFYNYSLSILLGVEGLEPSRPIDQQILSLLCLPFHHTPIVFKATPRFELGIEDLQSTALPLGHIALKETTILNIIYILRKVKEISQFIFS